MNSTRIITTCIKILFIFCLFSELVYSYFPNGMMFFLPDFFLLISLLAVFAEWFWYREIRVSVCSISLFFLLMLIMFLVLSFIWADRNIYGFVTRGRFILGAFMVFYLTTNYLDDKTYSTLVRISYFAQILNMFLVAYQNLIWHLHPDFTNGIFGFNNYANGIQGVFCLAMSILATIYYIDGKWGALKSLFLIAMSCIICALAEIKIFFVIFVISLILVFIFHKSDMQQKIRLIAAFIGIGFLFVVAYHIIELILPNNLYTFFNISGALSYENRTDYAGRTNTISFLWDNLYNHNYISAMIGKGLGSYSTNYIYELGKMFADGGFIALSLLYLFLLSLFIRGSVLERSTVSSERFFVSIMAVAIMVSIVVWNATFTRSTYLVFFFLSIGYVTYLPRRKIKVRLK